MRWGLQECRVVGLPGAARYYHGLLCGVGEGGGGGCRHSDSMNIVYNLLWLQAPSLHLAKVITETSVRHKVQLSPSGGLGVGGREAGTARSRSRYPGQHPGGVIIAGGNDSEKGREARSCISSVSGFLCPLP